MRDHTEGAIAHAPLTEPTAPDTRAVVLLVGFDRRFAHLLHRAANGFAAVQLVPTGLPVHDSGRTQESRPTAMLLSWEAADATLLRAITQENPDLGVVVLAHRLTSAQTRALLRCGAASALDRRAPVQTLVASVVLAARGLRTEPRVLPAQAADSSESRLSGREVEVLGLLECGETTTSIARLLGVSVHTVKSQARSIYRKVGVHSRSDLLRRGRDERLTHSE